MPYVEWLAKSNFSFLQGASHPEEMVLQAKELGYRGLALCDTNGLYGVVRAHQAIYNPSKFVADEIDEANGALRLPFDFYTGAELTLKDCGPLAFIPMNLNGYKNLCRLITQVKRSAPKGFSRFTIHDLPHLADDLIAFALPPWRTITLETLKDIFNDRLYIPVWRDFTWESLQFFSQACTIEQELDVPLFVTQKPLFHSLERKPLHDVLTCTQHGVTLKEAKTRLLSNSERHLKNVGQLKLLWKDRPELIDRTVEIAERVRFSLSELAYQYPKANIPEGKSSTEYLKEKCEQGLKFRFPRGVPKKVTALIEHELKIITELGYEDYFLTLSEICEFARKKNILHQGRGSAANSVVCFVLQLTSVDPDRFDLLFERFISRERGEPPDIDIDFESGRREEVIQHIYEKYGLEHAGMVATVICYRGRMALRETAKVLGISLETVGLVAKLMGREGFRYLRDHKDKILRFGLTLGQVSQWLSLAEQLISFPRHLGIHTGGFVISQNPITDCVPVEKATMDRRFVIQWNKDDIDVLKMMKVDVLGLGMLEALHRSLDLLKAHKGIDYNLATLPAEDPATYAMIQKAETIGVFQIESRAQMSLLPRLKPKNFYDLVVEVAIVRPGPLQGGMVHPYLRRRDGLETVRYAHPDLEKILKKTLGVPIFQEQIMQMAVAVCGFSAGESDELRRLMSSAWKRKDVMLGLRQRLISGMLDHGLSQPDAEQIYKTIIGFASYGFPESHAASFALLTYASCFIKKHHPDIFVCSLLNSQPMGFYAPRTLIADAQKNGVKFLPLDLQRSDYEYTLEGLAVRQGFMSVYGIHKKHIEAMLDARALGGPFKDLHDLLRRSRLNRNTLVRMAAADALSCFGLSPREALWKIQSLSLDQDSLLFGRPREQFDFEQSSEALPAESAWQKLNREYETQGYSIQNHPLALLRPALPGLMTSADLEKALGGREIKIAGLVSIKQKPPTAKGFCFITLEDEKGLFNLVLKPDIYTLHREIINFHPLLEVQGSIEKTKGVINIQVRKLKPITDVTNLNYRK